MPLPQFSTLTKTMISVIAVGGISLIVFGVFGVHTLFVDKKINEPLPEMVVVPTPAPLPTTPTTISAKPTTIKTGQLVEVDTYHKGEGTVQLWQQPDNSQFVRFDNVNIANGPDLWVFVSDTTTPGNTLESLGNYVDLGKLKGNIGSQNYQLPTLNFEPKSVVVWCKRFGVLFTYATLK